MNMLTTIKKRPPSKVMRLHRLGAFHQSRLSFMRVLLRRLKQQQWQFQRPLWRLDTGVGVATYQATTPNGNSYTLIAFTHSLTDEQRSDRVIASAWDATFTLFDGIPTERDIARLKKNVPLQEAGRIRQSELCLSRANRSVRLFQYVIDCLAQGRQPDINRVNEVGYLMRTTAVYGSSKFGAADRTTWAQRTEFAGSFQPELLTVWLIRTFTIDLIEHLAYARSGKKAVKLKPTIKRCFGIGNSTGLGMAPFLINHPSLMHSWIDARESALAKVRRLKTASKIDIEVFLQRLNSAIRMSQQWKVKDDHQMQKIHALEQGLTRLKKYLHTRCVLQQDDPWDKLYRWAEKELDLETQEQLVSLLFEPYGNIVDELADGMSMKEENYFHINGKMSLYQLKKIILENYQWALDIDFKDKESIRRIWYVSQEKLEPRLGDRFREDLADYEQPLAPGRDIVNAYESIQHDADSLSVADFLLLHPEHRHIIRRLQLTKRLPYAEIQDNTISAHLLPLDLLRCKLSFFGATKFDPRSDRWLRITMFQGCPYPDELAESDPDEAFYC